MYILPRLLDESFPGLRSHLHTYTCWGIRQSPLGTVGLFRGAPDWSRLRDSGLRVRLIRRRHYFWLASSSDALLVFIPSSLSSSRLCGGGRLLLSRSQPRAWLRLVRGTPAPSVILPASLNLDYLSSHFKRVRAHILGAPNRSLSSPPPLTPPPFIFRHLELLPKGLPCHGENGRKRKLIRGRI